MPLGRPSGTALHAFCMQSFLGISFLRKAWPQTGTDVPMQCFAGDRSADLFYADNRMGIEGTLHRISAIRNRDTHRSVIGLTNRVGRHMPGQP